MLLHHFPPHGLAFGGDKVLAQGVGEAGSENREAPEFVNGFREREMVQRDPWPRAASQ